MALVVFVCALLSAPMAAAEQDPAAAVQALASGGLSANAELVRQISDGAAPWARSVLQGLLDGALQTRKSDGRVVLAHIVSNGFELTDPVTGENLGQASRADLKRIPINNTLRTQLNGLIARLSLADPDPRQRRAAVRALFETLDADSAALLRNRRPLENNGGVRAAIDIALALSDLATGEDSARIAATRQLARSVEPVVRVRLGAMADDAVQPQDVRDAARRALASSEARIGLYRVAETAFFGLSLGSVLLLGAIGLAISFGVMGVINMAHGEFLMLGAYTTFVVQQWVPVDWSLPVAVPAAFLVAGAVGVLLERCLIRFLYGRPLETLLATFGVSLILQQVVRSVFSPLNRQVATPSWMSGSVEINPALSLTLNRVYIVVFSLVVFGALLAVLRFTRFGLELRAVSQNRAMARALGVRSARVDALTFGLGAGIAGVGGVALSQLTNVGPNLGQAYIVDAFLVVVFGGVGNLWGTFTAALTLGVANKLMEPWVGAVLAKILVLVFIILFIQRRPRGLFPQRGRAAEA